MKNAGEKAKIAAFYGLLIALAFLLSYIETLLPPFFFVPGMKLGLANLAVVAALYLCGFGGGTAVSLIRVLLVALTFTNLFSLCFSAAGAVCSFLVMAGLKRTKAFGPAGVSTAGGTVHNLAQLAVASAFFGNSVWYYLPALLAAGAATGFVIGLIVCGILKPLSSLVKKC